jgi:hypothetical protein
MTSATCAADRTGPVGTLAHEDWCKLHNRWTFDCLLKIKLVFYPNPKQEKKCVSSGK